ncbi:N-acetylglutamate synthase-like GNAT family acetyltransferase [Flavobacteriaceae bacterium MAR_2010_105]|nr:N-acetylglutamate synthase-like GNAT family acetyltransferase [Flavobacteriaceae bacterium MAR_2010_105]
MLHLKRTDSNDQDFRLLVKALDADLALRDGDDHDFYKQFNTIDVIKYAVVAYEDGVPVGCGAIKMFDSDTMEIKRMYVTPEFRGKGIAGKILNALEHWASQLDCNQVVLETGINQQEALALYKKSGFERISNYGQYIGVEKSFCFRKTLNFSKA